VTVLTITTCQAANTFAVTHHLADYLSAQLGMAVRCVDDVSWEERYRLLDAGETSRGCSVWPPNPVSIKIESLTPYGPPWCRQRRY
jgi:hypothetical protein